MLFELFDVASATRMVLEGLESPQAFRAVREGARRVAMERHSLDIAAPKLAEMIARVARGAET